MIAVVTGGSSGLGKLICAQLAQTYQVIDWSLETGVDVSKEWSVAAAAAKLKEAPAVLVNCAGINHLAPIPELEWNAFSSVLQTNVIGMWLSVKHLAESMRSAGTICNIVSNASHMPMTNSIAYNASKGAAAIMTRQMARELWRTHKITVFGVSPNKMAGTGMSAAVDVRAAELSGMTQEQAREYQLSKMLLGRETDPNLVAEFVGWLLAAKHRNFYLAGSILEYGI